MSAQRKPAEGLVRASRLLARPWTLLIIDSLAGGPMRFTEIAACLQGISTNLLTERLRALTGSDIVHRTPTQTASTYELTALGVSLIPTLHALGAWGEGLAD